MTTHPVLDGTCGATLLDRILHHSRETPRRTALVSWDAELDYGQLRDRIERIAAALRDHGMGRGSVVAVYMPRGAAAVAALLGVMRCGAAYTVVEQEGNEAERTARLRAIAPDLVIAADAAREAAARAGIRTVAWSDAVSAPARAADACPAAPGDVAYVLYTSGSTGVPKGVAVTHANLEHYTVSLLDRLGIAEPLGYAHVSALSADLGNTSLLLSLWSGGTLHVAGEELRRDPRAFGEYVRDRGIGFLKITPSHFRALSPGLARGTAEGPVLQYLLLGGEAFSHTLAREILASGITRTLVNHYGPTEATVGVSVHVVRDGERLEGDTVPIGSPFGRTELLVRTEDGTFARRGARGELYIGGPSVALGYVNDPAATGERFVTGIAGDVRFYRTGDLCRMDDAGVVQFLGRMDRQVKINGYRVELDHVAAALRALPGVRNANAVLVRRGEKDLLVAAYAGEAEGGETGLLEALRARLPGYMVPSRAIRRDAFPLNANGKVDVARVEADVRAVLDEEDALAAAGEARTETEPEDAVHQHVLEAWRTRLRHARFGDDADFFAAGGDSITAIQVISDLQVRGYSVTPGQFLKEPTVRALAQALRDGRAHAGEAAAELLTESTEFSAAQSWFFRQGFASPDHWNQCILLQADTPVEEATLERALASVLALHPLLRCSYRETERGWTARTEEQPASPCLTVLRVPDIGAARTADAVQRASEALNGQIALATGDVFKVCLVKAAHGPDLILAVCHHLSVDAVSWRIIVDDLVRFYSAYARDLPISIPSSPTGFWEWVRHVRGEHARLAPDLARWDHARAHAPRVAPAGANREELAGTVWIRFSAEETERLSHALPARLDTQTHVALLGAFARAYARMAGTGSVLVDVESHGRASFDERVDVSRVVGWFTSTFPVLLETAGSTHDCIAQARHAMADVPNLGMAYGELHGHPTWAGLEGAQAHLCYNYLGDFHFRHDDRLRLTVSRHPLAPARGAANDRGYDLKLTARTVHGELAVDLSFSRARHDLASMRSLLRETRDALLREAGIEADAAMDAVPDEHPSTGLLTYVPAALRAERPAPRAKRYRDVLLTGATGYVGVHVLHELLEQTDARIHCLVRAADPAAGRARLAGAYAHYLGHGGAPDFGRITIVPGDVAAPQLGLSDEAFRALATGLDAIYHFAADTRLFGPAERFERSNVASVQWLIRLASSYRAKDLHHMSTLAVAGVNRGAAPKVFSELCLDIGQEFQNEYERSKFQAEKLVFQFKAGGGSAYIYRSGNVTGRLDTAQFQRNASDNRLVQLLRAICKAGKLPESVDEDLALSPVDVVARAIVRVSLEPTLTAGVFHVDTTHSVPFAALLDQLREIGFQLESTDQASFQGVFQGMDTTGDADLALGLFWANRSSRNVAYEHESTHRLLSDLGCAIPPVDGEWLRRYLGRLVEDGVLELEDTGVAA